MVKSMTTVKRHEVNIEKGDFLVIIVHSGVGWMLSIEYKETTLFSVTEDTREAALRRLDDFIAGFIELSRCIELAMKKMEEIEEGVEKE
jgi:bifunctional DNA-binding transcriptional regulator/antitoxin component of YhaV-PrlF toxin-antitoxin module